ncbi:hypothetical protein M9H77_03907 [Catharanthus roseus]|uniref:Uncharacterized protein n=1 Tax=Catharanthus roseus TaxID=4058 RepID=A0ACC0CD07_CATRO|nr:hypothetical protein M9H77_03907 [Catharanthus roseus]
MFAREKDPKFNLIVASDLHPDYYCCEKEVVCTRFGENQVNGRVSGLHCTWLVSRTRASSDDVDEFLTLKVDPLEEGRSTLRACPIIIYVDIASCSAVGWSPSGESRGARN